MIEPVLDGSARYAGARVHRVEDSRLLTGQGTYLDDVSLPEMVHAYFVRSPYPRARLQAIDTSRALALEGVLAVFTAADLNPDVKEQWHTAVGPESPETPRPPLAWEEVRFVGDPVALVVASTRYLAEDAGDLVEVEYDPLAPVVAYTDAESTPDLVHPAHGSNLIGESSKDRTDELEQHLRSAPFLVSEVVSQQAYVPSPLEGRGIVVDSRPTTGELTIYSATQAPHEVRMFCARLLGIPEHRVRVIMRDTGGGFGQKVYVQREEMCIMLAAPKIGHPLKWVEDRHESFLAGGQARHEQARITMGFNAGGEIEAVDIDYLADCGAYPTPWPIGTGWLVGSLFPGPYRVPYAAFRTKAVYTNTVGRAPYRGPWQFETLAREVVLDLAARRMGMDPVALRRKNLLVQGDLPYTNPNGMTYETVSPLETFEQAIALLDYEAFRHQQAEARAAGRFLGVGVSNFIERTTPMAGYYSTEAATIRVEPSGMVNVYVAGGSAGNSIETTVAQLTADALGLRMEDVTAIQGDTAVTGFGGGTAGSRSGSMTAGAVHKTAAVLRERIVSIAAHKLEAAPEDIELAQSWAFVRGSPAIKISLGEVAWTAYFEPHSLPSGLEAGLEASGRYTSYPGPIWVNATHVCCCEVDLGTGQVTLLRYIVSEDCGPMINPNVVEGQIAGGTLQGIGGVLYESLCYDSEGNPQTTTFVDYLLPTTAETPVIEYSHVETASPGPGGYKGVGEGGAVGAPPAVVNAVADALAPFDVTITELPLSPDRISDLLDRAKTAQKA